LKQNTNINIPDWAELDDGIQTGGVNEKTRHTCFKEQGEVHQFVSVQGNKWL
jgi:hypothetical protein